MAETLYLIHQELLTELDLQIDKLSEELKVQVASLNGMVDTYNQAPTDELAVKINKISAKLWHLIKDFSENDLPEDDGSTPAPTPVAVVEEVEEPSFFQRLLG